MTATTRIITAQREDVLRVPDQALRFSPGGPAQTPAPTPAPKAAGAAGRQGHVWVLRDGQLRQVAIRTGLDDDTYSEVLEGELSAGEEVVVGVQRASVVRDVAGPRLFGR
jgi:HlyD family secretion protein